LTCILLLLLEIIYFHADDKNKKHKKKSKKSKKSSKQQVSYLLNYFCDVITCVEASV